jgi:uncharacterized membrane protein
MKDTAEAIERLLSHLGTLLRYFAPGFATLYVTAAVIPMARPFLSSATSTVVVLGMLLGPTIYGIHNSALVRPLWFLVVWWRLKGASISITKKMSDLDEQRWLRRASREPQIQSIQGEMDKWGSMQSFLYTLSYVLILIPGIAKICKPSSVSPNWWMFLLGGCFVLAATLLSENRITLREIEFAKKYPNGEIPNKANSADAKSRAAD